MQASAELGYKLSFSIGYYGLGYSMQLQNVVNVQLRSLSLPYVVHTEMKCATLVRRPTITHIESLPLGVLGSPLMKSILMSSHFHSGMGNDWSNPLGFWCYALTR
jgi:hypothetical protein